VRSTATDVSGHLQNQIEIWTTNRRRIVPFASVQGNRLIDITDLDGDGHPELIEDPYGATFGSSFGWVSAQRGWSMLVELDARGNPNDKGPLSQRWARTLCPTADDLLEWMPKQDPSCLAQYAHCARLWGVSPEAVDRAIDEYCKQEGNGPAGWCSGSSAAWRAIAHAPPPFVLQPLPAGATPP